MKRKQRKIGERKEKKERTEMRTAKRKEKRKKERTKMRKAKRKKKKRTN